MLALAIALAAQAPAPLALTPRTVLEAGIPLCDMVVDARGKRAFTLGSKGELTAWDLAKGEAVWRHEELGLLHLQCGEKTLVVAWGMPIVSTFDLESGERTSSLGGPPPYTATAGFASDSRGRWAWIGQERGLMRVTPGTVDGWSRRALDNGGVTTLALDADDELLAIGGRDGSVRFANCKSANVDDKKVLLGHTGAITALAFVSKSVVSASEDGSVRVWTLASGKEKHALQAKGPPVLVLAGEKGGRLAGTDGAGTLVLWDAAQGAERARWTSPTGTPIVAMAFTGKGDTLLAAAGTQLVAFDLGGK